MPTYSSIGHAPQFGNYGLGQPTVTVVGTDYDGYIIYDMSAASGFYQFAPNTKYFALQVIFDSPFQGAPGVLINPANATTAAYMTAQPGIEFYIEQGDVDGYQFKISGISSSTPQLGPTVLVWSYQTSGTKVSAGTSVTSVVNSDSTLTISPTTGSVVAGLNLSHANTWTATQTFSNHAIIDGYTIDMSGGAVANQVLQYSGSAFIPTTKTMFMGEVISSGTSGSVLFVSSTGTLAQDNSFLSYNSTNHTLTVGGSLILDGYTISPANATSGQALVYNGSAYVPQTVSGGGATGPRIIPAGFPTNSVLGTPTVAGAIQFNPADYSGFTTIKFRALAANGNSSVSTTVKLHDVTNSVDIHTFTFTGSTADTVQEQTLTVSSAGTDTIANSAAIYEISVYVNSPVTGGTNFIQLYSAEFRIA